MTKATRQRHLRAMNTTRYSRPDFRRGSEEFTLWRAAEHQLESRQGHYLKSIRDAHAVQAYLAYVAR